MIAMVVVLAVGASAMYVSIGGQRSATRTYHTKKAFFCGELALQRGRTFVVANWSSRDSLSFVTPACTTITDAVLTGNCPGPGQLTWAVTVEDDMPGSATDTNNRIFVHATIYRGIGATCTPLSKVSALLGEKAKIIGGYP